MLKRIATSLVSIAAISLFALSVPAFATPINATVNMGQVYTGATPSGSPPWLTANFSGETGSNTGTLTLNADFSGSAFLQGAHGNTGWAFHLGPSLDSLAYVSGRQADRAEFGGNYNAGPVHNDFNLAFGWDSGDRFAGTDTAVYTLTFSDPLTGNPFTKTGGFFSVAHVQGIGNGDSGWIVSDPSQGVPEPRELGLFVFGILGIVVLVAIRRRDFSHDGV